MSRDPRDLCKRSLPAMDADIAAVEAAGHKALAVAMKRHRDAWGAIIIGWDRAEQSRAFDARNVVRDQDTSGRRKAERPTLRKIDGGKR